MPHQCSQRGFTLVEMLVVISILVLLSMVVVANFRDTEKQNAVRLGTEQFVGALREAQNYALAQKRMIVGGQDIVPPGFGVYISTVTEAATEYTFFADTGAESGAYDTGPGGDLVIRTETLPRYAAISGLLLGGKVNQLSIIFSPPSGAVTFGNTGSIVGQEARVAIKMYQNGSMSDPSKVVTVNAQTSLIEINAF